MQLQRLRIVADRNADGRKILWPDLRLDPEGRAQAFQHIGRQRFRQDLYYARRRERKPIVGIDLQRYVTQVIARILGRDRQHNGPPGGVQLLGPEGRGRKLAALHGRRGQRTGRCRCHAAVFFGRAFSFGCNRHATGCARHHNEAGPHGKNSSGPGAHFNPPG
ncbi:MAG: hypothetical protein NTX28_11385 [Novosphingobium sp.]|nr:hypothetical protein [Novosphingobium sp.]